MALFDVDQLFGYEKKMRDRYRKVVQEGDDDIIRLYGKGNVCLYQGADGIMDEREGDRVKDQASILPLNY